MVMIIPDDLADRLRAIAKRENRPPEAVLRTLLDQYTTVTTVNDSNRALLRMAEAAVALDLRSDENDISERFDEMLRQTWASDLESRRTDDEQ